MKKVTSRTNRTQLPSLSDTHKLRSVEAKRSVHHEKTEKHYVDFDGLIVFLKKWGVKPDLFEAAKKNLEATDEEVASFSPQLDGLVKKILKTPLNAEQIRDLNKIYDYLTLQDQLQEVDIVFIFGGSNIERPLKAAELFKKGLAKKIICSGRGPEYEEVGQKTESEIFRDVLLEQGVPADKIIVEKTSITTPDNVRSVLNLLDELDEGF